MPSLLKKKKKKSKRKKRKKSNHFFSLFVFRATTRRSVLCWTRPIWLEVSSWCVSMVLSCGPSERSSRLLKVFFFSFFFLLFFFFFLFLFRSLLDACWYSVLLSSSVCRVYIGSFWDQPYQNEDFRKLFEAEQADLLADLSSLPANGTIRKVNELVKRARLVKVRAVSFVKKKEKTGAMCFSYYYERSTRLLLDTWRRRCLQCLERAANSRNSSTAWVKSSSNCKGDTRFPRFLSSSSSTLLFLFSAPQHFRSCYYFVFCFVRVTFLMSRNTRTCWNFTTSASSRSTTRRWWSKWTRC